MLLACPFLASRKYSSVLIVLPHVWRPVVKHALLARFVYGSRSDTALLHFEWTLIATGRCARYAVGGVRYAVVAHGRSDHVHVLHFQVCVAIGRFVAVFHDQNSRLWRVVVDGFGSFGQYCAPIIHGNILHIPDVQNANIHRYDSFTLLPPFWR